MSAEAVVASDREPRRMMDTIETFLRGAGDAFLNLFVVKSSSGSAVPYLDGIRGIAVIVIVVFHSWILSGAATVTVALPLTSSVIDLSPFLVTGYIGVDLFFVLSGFLLSQAWLKADFSSRPRPSISRYFRHRVFRIVPAYYACLFIMLLLFAPTLIPPEFIYSQLGVFLLGAHLLFLQHFFPISSGSYNVNGSLWTLSIEAIFYIILPWTVILFFKNRWFVTLPVLGALTMGWLYLCGHSMNAFVQFLLASVARYGVTEPIIREYLTRQFPAQFIDFALGIILANLFVRHQLHLNTSRFSRIIASHWAGKSYFFVGWALVLYSMEESSKRGFFFYYVRHITVPLGFTLVLASLLVGGTWIQRAFGVLPLRFVGLVGYSAYLWHMPLIYVYKGFPAIAALPPAQRFPQVLGHTAVALLLISMFFYLAIEKPFMVYARRGAGASPPRQAMVLDASPAYAAEPASASTAP